MNLISTLIQHWASVIIAGVIHVSSGRYYSPCMVADTIYILIYFADTYFLCRIWNSEFVHVCVAPLLLLWFLHRVGLCWPWVYSGGLPFFIALVPGQTIAAFSLMYLVILVSTVSYTPYIIVIRNAKWCANYFFLRVPSWLGNSLYTYIDISKNGLTSSTIGSVFFIDIAQFNIYLCLSLFVFCRWWIYASSNCICKDVVSWFPFS